MKRIDLTAIVFAAIAALFFTACQPKEPPTAYEMYSHTADEIDSETIMSALSENLSSVNVMSAENSERLRASLSDIRINNSRIALPLLVSDLPDGFQVQYGKGERLDDNYMYFDGELFFGGERIEMSDGGAIINGGERLADLTLLKGSGMNESEGVIFSMTLSSDICKWSIGEADICSPSVLEGCFGTPSAAELLSDEDVPDYFYISDSGELVRFMPSSSSVMISSFDCTRLEENKALCEYVPYTDFEGMTDLPPLTGDMKKFDAMSALNDGSVVIGGESLRPYMPISMLPRDFGLIPLETAPVKDSESVSDKYILLYKGRYFGSVMAMRMPELPAEEGMIYAWYLTGRENLPCDASLAGIPVSQDSESVAAFFDNCEVKEDGSLVMYDTCEVEGQKFLVIYSRSSGISALIAEPVSS